MEEIRSRLLNCQVDFNGHKYVSVRNINKVFMNIESGLLRQYANGIIGRELEKSKSKIDEAIKHIQANLLNLKNWSNNGVKLSSVIREWEVLESILEKEVD